MLVYCFSTIHEAGATVNQHCTAKLAMFGVYLLYLNKIIITRSYDRYLRLINIFVR